MRFSSGRKSGNKIRAAPRASHCAWQPPIDTITATKDGVNTKRVYATKAAPSASATFNAPRYAPLDHSPISSSDQTKETN
jgi:hypothetical protein